MIIYIHGFGGSGEGIKSKLFREYFKNINEPFISPSLSYIPELAIQTLQELIESYDDVKLIGSSLGGYYSIYLADKYNLQAVLLNPSIKPTITLKKVIGNAPSFYDESSFTWNDKHISMLEQYEIKEIKQNLYMLLTQKGDETLNYKVAVDKLNGSKMIVEEGGSHSFNGIEKYFERIKKYFMI